MCVYKLYNNDHDCNENNVNNNDDDDDADDVDDNNNNINNNNNNNNNINNCPLPSLIVTWCNHVGALIHIHITIYIIQRPFSLVSRSPIQMHTNSHTHIEKYTIW
uniref:Uncharacterized protein n=1 Tax=Octopus bimaculoides TaxID=37653 RepID=A0A0L8HK73_OCTBM